MDSIKYLKIRNSPDFIYLYFLEVTGNKIPKDVFYNSLGIWIEMFNRCEFQNGLRKITTYLDKINTN